MERKEFRIGNYVTSKNYDLFGTIIKVESIDSIGINLFNEEDNGVQGEISYVCIIAQYTFDELFGIPLTEEILKKCGFENYNVYWTNTCKKINLFKYEDIIIGHHINDEEYYLQEYDADENIYFDKYKEIKYFHQLQNLVFILNGKELEINF